MKKILSIIAFVALGWVLNAQNYMQLSNATGIKPSASQLTELQTEVDALVSVLPEDTPFNVYDCGFYIYNDLMVGDRIPAIWEEMKENAANDSEYYLLIGRQYDHEGKFYTWRIDLKMPLDVENIACSTIDNQEFINKSILSELRLSRESKVFSLEKEAIAIAKRLLNKVYNCCIETGVKDDKNGTRNEYSCNLFDLKDWATISSKITDSLFHQDRFVELTNVVVLNENLDYTISQVFETKNYLDEFNAFSQEAGGNISLTQKKLFIADNIESQVPDGYDEVWDSKELVDYFENIPLPTGTSDYAEQLVLVNFKGEYRLFLRMSQNINTFQQGPKGQESRILPVLLARWIVKKLWEAGTGVMLGFTMEVVVQKYFIHDNECDWAESIQYAFYDTPPYKFLTWAVEGALESGTSAAFVGAVSAGINYVFETNDFNFNDLFKKMVFGGIEGFIINYGVKYIGKGLKAIADAVGTSVQKVVIDLKIAKVAMITRVKAWKVIFSNSKLRSNVDNLTNVNDYLKKHPTAATAVKNHFDNLADASRKKSFINALKYAARDPLSIPNARRANADEISEAVTRIAKHRGKKQKGNYGYVDGTLTGTSEPAFTKIYRSGEAKISEPQIFDAVPATGNSGTWLRDTDSEYKMLNDLADRLGGVKGGAPINSVSGSIKIVSENPYCPSCAGVIQQFNQMFPNINLILIDGVK